MRSHRTAAWPALCQPARAQPTYIDAIRYSERLCPAPGETSLPQRPHPTASLMYIEGVYQKYIYTYYQYNEIARQDIIGMH